MEISDLPDLKNVKIKEIVLPAKYEFFSILTDYVIGTKKPEGIQNVFASKIYSEVEKNPRILEDIYSENEEIVLVLSERGINNNCGLKKSIDAFFRDYVTEITGQSLRTPEKIKKVFLDSESLDVFAQNGSFEVVKKSPVDVPSLINQNILKSAPVYTISDAVPKRGKDIYRV